MKRKAYGFTIVELLIVIVVVGVLAAISIVAYSGVQGRAKDAAARASVEGLIKELVIAEVESGGRISSYDFNDFEDVSYRGYSIDSVGDADFVRELSRVFAGHRSSTLPDWMPSSVVVGYDPSWWDYGDPPEEFRATDEPTVDLGAAAKAYGYSSSNDYINDVWSDYDEYWDYGDAESDSHFLQSYPQFACALKYWGEYWGYGTEDISCGYMKGAREAPAVEDLIFLSPKVRQGCSTHLDLAILGYRVKYYSHVEKEWVTLEYGDGVAYHGMPC